MCLGVEDRGDSVIRLAIHVVDQVHEAGLHRKKLKYMLRH